MTKAQTPKTKEQTPKTPRSIVRNHSPYSESTGPIVQEGFVAARVRALQGFSAQTQNVARSHAPLTSCPLHVYKLRSSPRLSFTVNPVLTGTDMPNSCTVKRFHTHILSKDHWNLVNAPGGPATCPDLAFPIRSREQQSFIGRATLRRSCVSEEGAGIPSQNQFRDTVPSSSAQKSQDHVTAPSTPHGTSSELIQVNDMSAENSLSFEKSVLSPHAIRADLVESRTTWNCLLRTEGHNNDYTHEQALKPRGSIADKLGSMVERGWKEGDTFGEVHSEDSLASHAMESNFPISDMRLDSRSNPLDNMPLLQKVLSFSGSFSVSNAETRSESQCSTRQGSPPHVKQKELRGFVYHGSRMQRNREAKRSHSISPPQRSSSDAGLQYLNTGVTTQKGKRRAWTLHPLGHSKCNHSQTQPQASLPIWQSYAWEDRSSEPDHGSKTPQSSERSLLKSGPDPTMLRNEQLNQNLAAPSEISSSRRPSANTKASTRSASTSTSFFKKFPWYKVALVDKQSVAHSLLKGGCDNDRASKAAPAGCCDPNPERIKLSQDVSKSHTPVACRDEEEENSPKTVTPLHQGLFEQQAIDAITSYFKPSGQPSLGLMTSPEEMNERQAPKNVQRLPERPHYFHATGFKVREERRVRDSHQAANDVIGDEHGPTRTGRFGTKPRLSPQSGSMDASFESPARCDSLQSLRTQGPEVKEHSRVQSHTSSYLKDKGSSGSEIARPGQGSTARPSLSQGALSEAVNLTPKPLGSGTGSSPAGVQRSEQPGPVHRDPQGGGKGIKKIQVTVTFDGAEDLVIEAVLRMTDRQEQWKTMA